MRLVGVVLMAVVALVPPASAQEPSARVPFAVPTQNQRIPTLAPLVKKVAPAVVNIAIRGRIAQQLNPLFNDPFFRRFFNLPEVPAERQIRAAGSGVIVDAARGLVVTNHHVIEHADEIAVTLNDGRRFRAERVGADPATDIAVVRIPAEGLVAIPLGDSDKLEVGDFVVAIGNPFGLGQTVTMGIVSALRRTGLGIEGYEDFIQTDAPINPGNSGGALIDLRGELVGINTAIVGPSGGNVGIGFAIPVNMVREIMDQIVQYGEVRRGQLGLAIQDLTPDLAQAMGLPTQLTGAVIAKVEPGSPAERAGLKVGDVVTEVGKEPIRNAADLRNKIGLRRIGEQVELTVMREGKRLTVRATLAAPAKVIVEGATLSPLLEGATFGPVSPDAATRGVEVVSVQAGSRAASLGLRKGDVITSVNQKAVTHPDDFAAKVKESPQRLLLNLVRDGTAIFILLQ